MTDDEKTQVQEDDTSSSIILRWTPKGQLSYEMVNVNPQQLWGAGQLLNLLANNAFINEQRRQALDRAQVSSLAGQLRRRGN